MDKRKKRKRKKKRKKKKKKKKKKRKEEEEKEFDVIKGYTLSHFPTKKAKEQHSEIIQQRRGANIIPASQYA